MPDYGYFLIGLVAGSLFGVLIGWLAGRKPKLNGVVEELRLQLSRRDAELTNIRQELGVTLGLGAEAEEKSRQVPELREQLRARDEEASKYRDEVGELKTARASLQTTLDKERQGMQEKIALLDEAQCRLADA